MKHLRTVADVKGRETLLPLLARAEVLKRARRQHRLAPTLTGRVVSMWFERESTRTRISFEAGVALLGGSTVVLQARDTQTAKGEPMRDAARVVGQYTDALVVRSREHQTIEEFARHAQVPVINGLTDLAHPCQLLTDLFTVYERKEEPLAARFCYLGQANSIAFGYVRAAAAFGLDVTLCVAPGPRREALMALAQEAGVTVADDPVAAVTGRDVICTARWHEQTAADEEAGLLKLQVSAALLTHAAESAVVLHPLPAQRGAEITDDVLEGRRSLAFDQAGNRLCVQQAILEWLLAVPGLDQF